MTRRWRRILPGDVVVRLRGRLRLEGRLHLRGRIRRQGRLRLHDLHCPHGRFRLRRVGFASRRRFRRLRSLGKRFALGAIDGRLGDGLRHQLQRLRLILSRLCVVAAARVRAAAIGVCARVVGRSLDDLGVIGDGLVDVACQDVGRRAVVIARRVVGSPLDNLGASLDSQLGVLALETILARRRPPVPAQLPMQSRPGPTAGAPASCFASRKVERISGGRAKRTHPQMRRPCAPMP